MGKLFVVGIGPGGPDGMTKMCIRDRAQYAQ